MTRKLPTKLFSSEQLNGPPLLEIRRQVMPSVSHRVLERSRQGNGRNDEVRDGISLIPEQQMYEPRSRWNSSVSDPEWLRNSLWCTSS